MISTAVIAVRNEEAYLGNCLRHLVRNDVRFAILDHGSTDETPRIYRRAEFNTHLVDVQTTPFDGVFSLSDQLRRKMELIGSLETDWVVHLDADEIMHSYRDRETLTEALARLDAAGWNAVNFDEFVFLPIEADYEPETAGPQRLRRYYFFEPQAPRLMRAWRKASGLSMVEQAGHGLTGPDLRLAPEHLALRHYIVRDQAHAFSKYAGRQLDQGELAQGWHRARVGQPAATFTFPSPERLKRLDDPADRDLDRRDPWVRHYWQQDLARPPLKATA